MSTKRFSEVVSVFHEANDLRHLPRGNESNIILALSRRYSLGSYLANLLMG